MKTQKLNNAIILKQFLFEFLAAKQLLKKKVRFISGDGMEPGSTIGVNLALPTEKDMNLSITDFSTKHGIKKIAKRILSKIVRGHNLIVFNNLRNADLSNNFQQVQIGGVTAAIFNNYNINEDICALTIRFWYTRFKVL